ncbi:MAG: CBS domain-containing protein, partial [Isosphaeraceae bacterium]|nr:CBS domain-containing protein [Isosphaeraceae bacterium]
MMATPNPSALTTWADLRNPDLTAADVMRTDFRSCNATTPVAEVATALRQSQCPVLAVTRAQIPIGIVTEHGLVTALAEHGGDLSHLTAGDLMVSEPTTIPMKAPLEEVANRLAESGGYLLAVNPDGLLKGVVTLAELGPQLSEAALGRLIARLTAGGAAPGPPDLGGPQAQPGRTTAPAVAARAADPTAEIKSSKSQAQPHPWDSPTGAHPEPVPLVSPSDLVNPMLTVADVMTANPRTVSPYSTALEAVLVMRDANCGVLPVTEDGRPVGVVTDRD